MLVLLHGGITGVVTNQILQSGKPLLALARHIVLAVSTGNLVVEDSQLLIHKRQDKASWVALALAYEISARFQHILQPQTRRVSTDVPMIPPAQEKHIAFPIS